MSHRRGAYAPEFRRQIVGLVGLGRKPKDLAAEFGCHITSIQDWVRQAKIDSQGETVAGPLTTAEREELA